ncbi:hypothetical protein LZT21_09360 [Polynucleobacter sp. IMCC 30228]|nr:hypothetical protein [Polynucleobacter sp. IMCC 30228]
MTISIAIIWLIVSFQHFESGIFWDLGVYTKAINIFNNGGDPYSPNQLGGYLSFVYHPLILHGMALFGSWLLPVLITFYFASMVYFLFSLRNNSNLWLSLFLAFAYCGIGLISLASGNLTVFLHLILLAILVKSLSQNLDQNKNQNLSSFTYTNTTFVILVIAFSSIKPYFLVYLAIPLIMQWGKNEGVAKTIRLVLTWVSIFFALMISSSLFYSTEFSAFIATLQNQTLGKRDLGYGFVMFFYDYYLSAGPLIYRAFVLHFAIAVLLLLIVIYLAIKNKWLSVNKLNSAYFPFLLYFLLTLFNPRLKVYDLFPAFFALYVYFFSLKSTTVSRLLFLVAYALSLTQLTGSVFFASQGIFANPINAYYWSMGIIFLIIIVTLAKPAPN